MKKSQLLGALCIATFGFFTLSSQAALESRLGGLAYYDTVLDITWLANANLAATDDFGVAGIDSNGRMYQSTSIAWIAALNADGGTGYLGYDDWRLPTVSPINGSAFDYNLKYDGCTDRGYNISAPGTIFAGATGSEMAYIFYNNLALTGAYDTSGSPTGCPGAPNYCLNDTGPFSNLQPSLYWSGTNLAIDTSQAWEFTFNSDEQHNRVKSAPFYA